MTNLNTPVTETELKIHTNNIQGARITDEQVEAYIVREYYFTAGDGVAGSQMSPASTIVSYDSQLDILTFCVLVLANGYTVHGISACADPKMFDAEIGKRIARSDAKNKIWPLLGFVLRSGLALLEEATPPSYEELSTYVGRKVIHAVPMDKKSYCSLRGWDVPADEDPDEEGYLVEYADGGKPNLAGFTGYVSWSPKDVFEKAYSLTANMRPVTPASSEQAAE